MLPGFKEDISNFDLYNTDEQKVLESNYFSAYKGKLVIRLPIGTNAFSFGIMFLGNDLGTGSDAIATVRHEYGHTQQLEKLGIWKYITQVAIPSVTAYRLDLKKDLPYSYFTAPWEADADKYGGVDPSERKNPTPWTEDIGYYDLWDLIQTFF